MGGALVVGSLVLLGPTLVATRKFGDVWSYVDQYVYTMLAGLAICLFVHFRCRETMAFQVTLENLVLNARSSAAVDIPWDQIERLELVESSDSSEVDEASPAYLHFIKSGGEVISISGYPYQDLEALAHALLATRKHLGP